MNSAKIQTKNFAITKLLRKFAALKRKVGRVIECAGLEIRYTHCGYRGFESLTFRQKGNRESGSLFSLRKYVGASCRVAACCNRQRYGNARKYGA